jgi:phage terminase Nu1 subunit (DNA packaging protein)
VLERQLLESQEEKAYSTKAIAEILMLSERRVQQLAKEKVIPRLRPGEFRLAPAVQGYIRFLQERMQSGSDPDLQRERALLTKVQRETAELELAALRGEMHKSEDVMTVWTECVVNCRSRLLSIPTKLAPVLYEAETVADIQEALKKAVYEALDELAEYSKERISGMAPVDEE